MPKQNFDRNPRKPQISALHKTLLYQQGKKIRKYSVNTLPPYLASGCIKDVLIMVPCTSKLEDHAVEHDLPGGGNASSHAVGIDQHIQDPVHTANCLR